ncbi:MAG: hypothetical protein KC420_11720, partial [Myxococcales bacterium]|nr:hypothetical protein [Myxococcales bacterium]
MANNVSLRSSVRLLRHRGEAHIDLAKACARALSENISPTLRQRGNTERDKHLEAAQRDLDAALGLAQSDTERAP